MEKIIGQLQKYDKWDLDPRRTLNNISLTAKDSYDLTKNLVLFGFTCWQLKISRGLKKNVIKEAYWVGGSIFCFKDSRYYLW